MSTTKAGEENIRQISKEGKTSLGITLPIELARKLKWKAKQKVTVRKWGKGLLIQDWRKKH